MLFSGQPQGRHYWDGTRFVMAPMPQGMLTPPPPPSMQAPVAQQPQMQGLLDQGPNAGGNSVGGAPTSSAAAPAGFSTAGTPNPGQSPSIAGGMGGIAGSQNSRGGMSLGSAGGVLGAGAGLAMGMPGAGLFGNALGTYADVSRTNADLEKAGLPSAVSFGPAFMSNMSGGLLGTSAAHQESRAHAQNALAAMGDLSLAYDMERAMAQNMSPISAALGVGLFGTPNDGSGLGGIGAGATGAFGSLADGTAAGYGALGTPSSYGFSDLGGGGQTSSQADAASAADASGGYFRRGGYTGDDGDKKLEARRITAHEGEYVIRPEATAYYGQGLLKAINERRIPRGLLG